MQQPQPFKSNNKSTKIRQIQMQMQKNGTTLQKNYKRIIVLLLLLIGAIWLFRPTISNPNPNPNLTPVMTGGGVKVNNNNDNDNNTFSQILSDTSDILRKFN